MQIPGYKIIDTLGEGGMARVYLAIQTSFEREVALKVLDPHLSKDPSFTERFLHEARLVSRLVHPNIVTVYDMGVHRGYHYLSMEYVPGRDLKHRRFELSLSQSIAVIKDVARALDYAGRKGCVHRDIKPDNIMLHSDDNRAVLMDFGIARIVDQTSSMTQTGTTVGTPHYMSPEHARGDPVDSRADLYSLGVVLFLLLSGYLPYDSDSAVAIGVKHISESIPKLPAHLGVFQPIIDKVLAKRPDDRYQTGEELIADLDVFSPEALAALEREGERTLVENSDGESPTLHQPQPVIAEHDGDTDEGWADSDRLRVDDEDRMEHLSEPEEHHRRGLLLSLILLSALGLAALYYWQAPLQSFWREQVAAWAPQAPSSSAPVATDGAVAPVRGAIERDEVGSPGSDQSDPGAQGGDQSDAGGQGGRLAAPGGEEGAGTEESAQPGDANEESAVRGAGSQAAAAEAQGAADAPAVEEPVPTAGELVERVEQLAADGALASALASAEQGLGRYPNHPELLDLQTRLSRQVDQQRRQEQERQANESRLAAEVEAVERLMDAGELVDAGERLQQAREAFPGSAELLALEVEWQERREAALSPAIERTSVSGTPMTTLEDEQAQPLSPGRVLYAGFAFRNFAETSTVVQAMLYDGSRQMQIAQVPVIVQGDSGEAFFRIERPVIGFAEGGYHLDLVADGDTLASVSFQVGNGGP